MDLTDKIVLITGGYGFLGTHVTNALIKRANAIEVQIGMIPSARQKKQSVINRFRSAEYNLTDELHVIDLFKRTRPHVVIHLAAQVGGIGINRKKPGTFYYSNLMMGALTVEHSKQFHVDKFVGVGTVCSYPNHTPIPFMERDLWNGFPEVTNAPYGIAKKAMLMQLQAYRQEFNFNGIYLIPVNLYGPGDNFNAETSHVIPALIKKCIEARDSGQASIECWGSGSASREFLYVEDAAEAIVTATEKYDGHEPVNLGSGNEVTIKELVELIAKLCKFTGNIVWNPEYPDGQPRRCLDTSKAQKFGFKASTALEDGLATTIEWYEKTK